MQDYYSANASKFITDTGGLDMSALYRPFLSLVPTGGRILDAGCGSGRDAKNFAGQGYQVTAFDASEEMCRRAAGHTGLRVERLRFQDVRWVHAFDGIWACASLLHVPANELDVVLLRLARALVPGGVLFASFKEGAGERVASDGRRFTDQTRETAELLIQKCPSLTLIGIWETRDVRSDKVDQTWVNLLARSVTA